MPGSLVFFLATFGGFPLSRNFTCVNGRECTCVNKIKKTYGRLASAAKVELTFSADPSHPYVFSILFYALKLRDSGNPKMSTKQDLHLKTFDANKSW